MKAFSYSLLFCRLIILTSISLAPLYAMEEIGQSMDVDCPYASSIKQSEVAKILEQYAPDGRANAFNV
jgi:hypothetical protein